MNDYSPRWRSVFGETDVARTEADVLFLTRVLPLPDYRRVLDVPCGAGRLVDALTSRGYDVLGVDNDPAVAPALVADLRELDSLPDGFDAVISMWASFGYFDEATNEHVLASFVRRLRPGGRLVLDLFSRTFFERGPAEVERELRPGILERSRLVGNRRRVELDYGDGHVDRFDWQLYSPGELEALARDLALRPVLVHASDDAPAMQLVLERYA